MLTYIGFKLFQPDFTIQGWYSLMVAILFLGGVQLLSIGIIGEYLIRVSNNVKGRPLYLLNETNIDLSA